MVSSFHHFESSLLSPYTGCAARTVFVARRSAKISGCRTLEATACNAVKYQTMLQYHKAMSQSWWSLVKYDRQQDPKSNHSFQKQSDVISVFSTPAINMYETFVSAKMVGQKAIWKIIIYYVGSQSFAIRIWLEHLAYFPAKKCITSNSFLHWSKAPYIYAFQSTAKISGCKVSKVMACNAVKYQTVLKYWYVMGMMLSNQFDSFQLSSL